MVQCDPNTIVTTYYKFTHHTITFMRTFIAMGDTTNLPTVQAEDDADIQAVQNPYVRLEAGKHSPVNVDLANSFWDETKLKHDAILNMLNRRALKDDIKHSKYLGHYIDLDSLIAAIPEPTPGDYADVDAGEGSPVVRYIWDETDQKWEAQVGESTQLSGEQIKELYESEDNTNAFTDADKAKLDGLATGATKNDTDANLKNRANHTGTQAISTVSGLQSALDSKEAAFTKNTAFNKNFGTAAGTVAQGNDSRLSDSREWTAETVSQAEAEAGTATTARKWTAQRVRQAIAAWWSGSEEKAKLDGLATGATKNDTDANLKNRANHTGTQAISTVSGLQSALDSKATSNHSHSAATTSAAGFMSAADKTKLDGIAAGANAYSLPDSAPTVVGGVKTRLEGSILYMTNNGDNP